MNTYATRLHSAIQHKRTAALVGLDPRFDWLPGDVRSNAEKRCTGAPQIMASAFEEFCKRIIDVVAPHVPAVKPQSAFFELSGPDGVTALGEVISHARAKGLITILDAKRGDIGSTAEAYANGLLGGDRPDYPWQADALTVNPYLGSDTLVPFIDRARQVNGGIYVLVRTSNPGAGTFQDRVENEQTLFETIADVVEQHAQEHDDGTGYGPVGAVVGATYPDELRALRRRMPHVPLLIPGYGSQGGTVDDVAAAFDADGFGAVVNSSRAINFAYRDEGYRERFNENQWEDAVLAATKAMIDDLAKIHTY